MFAPPTTTTSHSGGLPPALFRTLVILPSRAGSLGANQVSARVQFHKVVDPAFAVTAALVLRLIVDRLAGIVRHIRVPIRDDLFGQAVAARKVPDLLPFMCKQRLRSTARTVA